MNSKLEYLPKQYFAYMRRIGAYGEENYTLMDKFKSLTESNNQFNHQTIVYGIARDNPENTLPNHCRYDVGMVVDEDYKNVDLQVDILDGGKYLSFEVEHTANAVQFFWNNVFDILLKEKYKFDNSRCILEKYTLDLVNNGLCGFHVPVI